MGEVWRARDTRLSREVALKVLPASLAMDRERLQRFEREAQVLASLNHPNIASIYGVEEAGGETALVLELVEGPTLEERISQGALPAEEAVAITRQIAEALEYAHERGVVHRDLKPANIKLSSDGRVKVLDYGLAKAMAPDAAGRSDSAVSPTITSLGTVAGVILGSAAYMAPEQARGSNVDRRADIWSFGVVLWEMLTGKRLFDDATVSDTLAAVLRAPIEWGELPAAVPAGLVRLLKRCLERDPKKRLRDIGEARIALETLGTEPEAAAAASAPAPEPRRSLASTLVWAAAVAVVALSVVAIVGFMRKPASSTPVIRFEVPVQDKMTSMVWPRLSPDGTMLAFQARGASGKTSIWVRRLDAFEAQELPGTEGAARHWWSPDSRYIAFFNGNQLKKIAATGGPAQLISEGESGADGAWGAGGTILFDGRAIDPIHRVDASGGKAVQATVPDTSNGEVGHAWPCFLPDGKHFLYLAMPGTPDKKATIMAAALGAPGSKALTTTNSRVEYANGYLLYVLDGTLVAQRFDPDKLVLAGEPIPIAEHVATDTNGAAGFSASSTAALAYASGTGGGESDLVWVDRDGRESGKIGEPGAYRDVALSLDGTRLAYGRTDPRGGADDIWVRDLRRDVGSRLTFGTGDEFWPVWAPDGNRVAYASGGGGSASVYVKDANGAGDEKLLVSDAHGPVGPSSWSRDGKWMAVLWVPPSRRLQIKLLPMQGEPKLVDYAVADVSQSSAQISPDGRFVAYTSNESGTRELYVQTLPLGGGKWQISSGTADSVAWRADGKELFYKTLGDDFVAVPIATGPRFEPGLPKTLFKRAVNKATSTAVGTRWAVTADGQKFLINASRESRGAPFSVVVNWPETLAQR
jgi:Tol biopolymer transport system component